ncbi:MAG TPA: aspartyl protease family protein, partial [Rhizomicrobium sp.]|nr:aspartyl protease family protein [Rhizomicrobium sp.]
NSLQRSAFALAPTRAYGGAMKSPPRVLTFLSLMALALGTTGARADDSAAECSSNLRILNSVQMQATTDRTVMVVPVKIDNVDKKLLLDTGGLVSQISRATANGLDLPERYREQRLFDLAGNSSNAQATVPKLTLGNQSQNEVPMAVAPNPDLGTALPYDGLLATDLFPGDDIDMDFGARRLTTFSPDHCTGRVVYWPADRVAIVPITENHNLIIIPVMVAGHPLNAVLDTGSQYTVMNMAVANQLFGLNSASPNMTPLTEANGDKSITLYRHLFDKLTFEGVEVSNLQVYLLPNQVAVHDRPRSLFLLGPSHIPLAGNRVLDPTDAREPEPGRVSIPDVIIGMDVLRHLHVYFAAKEKRLYITDAVSGESALFHYKE